MDGSGLKRPADAAAPTAQDHPPSSSPPQKKQKFANGSSGARNRPFHASHQNHKKPSKQSYTNSNNPYGSNPIGGLRSGLDFVLASGFSKEAAYHAKELHKLMYGVQASSTCTGDSTEADVDSSTASTQAVEPAPLARRSLTDVPPPFSVPSSLVADLPVQPYGTQSTNWGLVGPYPDHMASSERGHRRMPPLPPVTDLGLLSAPFTHSSTLPAYVPRTSLNCYENLEFLGDAYIEIIASRLIHRSFPDLAVGQWAQLRESLVCNDNLAKYSRAYGFDKQVVVTQQERDSPKTFTKILADVFEAYVAAVMLSNPTKGFVIVETWLDALFQPAIDEWFERGGKTEHLEHINQDAKSDLFKILQARGVKIEYLEEKPMQIIRPGNTQRFFIGAFYTGFDRQKLRLGGGEGRSKAVAGTAAAKDALTNNTALIAQLHELKVEHDKTWKAAKKDGKKEAKAEGHTVSARGPAPP